MPTKILPFCHESGRLRAIFARGGRIVHNFCGITCMHKKSIIRICRVSPCGSAKAAEQKANEVFWRQRQYRRSNHVKVGEKIFGRPAFRRRRMGDFQVFRTDHSLVFAAADLYDQRCCDLRADARRR